MSNPFAGMEIPSPAVSLERAAQILDERYHRSGPLRSLGSHQDQNVRVDDAGGRFILKISNPGFSHEGLVAQNAAMLHLAERDLPFRAPVPLPDASGALIGQVTDGGAKYDVRLVTYLEGRPLADFDYLAPSVLRRQGWLAASAAAALADFDHPGLDRTLQWDVRHASDVVAAFGSSIADAAGRSDVEGQMARSQEALKTLAPQLRLAVCHADVTDVNVVTSLNASGQPWPDALIDFGDLLRTWVAADVAVAAVSLIGHDPDDALGVLTNVLRGYHSVLPLTDEEVAALWPLLVARAASSVASSEHQGRLEPDDAYVQQSIDDDWLVWRAVRSVPWRAAHGVLAESVGMTAPAPPLPPAPVGPLVAMVAGSPSVDQSVTADTFDPERWNLADGVVAQLRDGYGVGRYGEGRLARSPGDGVSTGGVSTGVEVFAPAGTEVRAPTSGVVRSLDDGALTLGLDDTWQLVLGDLDEVTDAPHVEAGDRLGVVRAGQGAAAGVTVQLVADLDHQPPMLAARADGWRHATTDPAIWWAPDAIPGVAPASPSDATSLLHRRDAVLASAQEYYYEEPPRMERGRRHHMFNTDGRRYVDMVNNVTILGHSHPVVAEAVSRQLRLINTNSRFHYASMVEFSERLAALLPDPLDTVFLVSTGSEANEVALRLMRAASGSREILAVRSAYHGWTTGTDDVTTSITDNPRAAETRPPWVHIVESPNTYRGQFRGPDAGARYAADVDRALAEIAEAGGRVSGFIAEPVYGNAGGVLLPDGYLAATYASVRAAGGLCVADEVQVGYGRLGDYFWGFQQQAVVPDIVTMAKCTGNGVPVGAVVTTRAIAETLRSAEGSFFSSMGGSPLGCAAGIATLDVIESEGLQANALTIGRHIAERVTALADDYALIGTVHGLGLYRGIELVRDHETLEPATEEALAICERMRELGVIVQPTSDFMNVLKIKPPLCIDRAAADTFVDALETTLHSGW
ncbi:MAG: aminotransferase [Actinomycetia bacterium]|nr:aminotransferase [Actinomycetes bacterium]